MGVIEKGKKLLRINILQYVYYNYFSKKVIRDKGCKLIPYKGTQICIANNARIELHGRLILNTNKVGHSKAECLLLLRDNARFTVNGDVELYYGTTLQVHKGARLTMGKPI